jgi:hypothetical protein
MNQDLGFEVRRKIPSHQERVLVQMSQGHRTQGVEHLMQQFSQPHPYVLANEPSGTPENNKARMAAWIPGMTLVCCSPGYHTCQ